MNRELLNIVRSPCCQHSLRLYSAVDEAEDVREGTLTCEHCENVFPIRNYVPRFVAPENYAVNFGLQWNRFRQTQLDSHSGAPISYRRFFAESGWSPEELRGKRVLDVGCGAGRFAEIALSCGANVVAVDYSSAVDACLYNLRGRGQLQVIQGDIYALPFVPHQFDYVYCFGVLQHTPDVKKSLQLLPGQLRPGGKLAIDVYPKGNFYALWPKYWLRHITRHIPAETLFWITERAVPALLPLSLLIGRLPVVGRKLRHVVPILNYDGVLPLSHAQVREWAILDTFDMYSAIFDQPQSVATVESWLRELDLAEIEVFRKGFVVGRATGNTADFDEAADRGETATYRQAS